MNFVDREKQTEKFWEDHDIFKKSMEQRKQGETYTFYDGPCLLYTSPIKEVSTKGSHFQCLVIRPFHIHVFINMSDCNILFIT